MYTGQDDGGDDDDNDDGDDDYDDNFTMLQLFVCSGVWASDFAFGLSFGAPAVLIPQVRRKANSTEAITEDMASWICK